MMAWHNWSWKSAAATEGRGLPGEAQRTGRMDGKQPTRKDGALEEGVPRRPLRVTTTATF